jgi:hypothetical protein
MPLPASGTAFGHGLSVYTDGGSAVSAYGPVIGRAVAVVAQTVPSILDSTSIDTTFAVSGAAVGDTVLVGYPSGVSAGVFAQAFVPSAGNITLRLIASSGTAAQTAQTWDFTIHRRSFMTSIR